MTDIEQLTPEQIAAREAADRDKRSRNALKHAPDLLHHVRAIAVSGQAESGETLREWSAPMRITAADAADEVFAQLVDWRTYWQDVFNLRTDRVFVAGAHQIEAPEPWRHRNGNIQGFASGTTPELAQILTRVQTRVLLEHADDISQLPTAAVYQDDVAEMLGALNAQFPMSAPIDFAAIDETVTTKPEYLTDDTSVAAEIRYLMIKPYLLPSEAAILVQKTKRTINNWIKHPEHPLTTYSHEGQKYVRLEEVRDWMETYGG